MDEKEIQEESKIKRILKRVYIIIIALFLISLFIINIIPGYHVLYVISGKLVSTTLQEGYTFSLPDSRIVFDSGAFEQLRQLYLDNQQHEIKVCLTGEKEDNNYYVTGLYVPEIYHQDFRSVTSARCNLDTVVSLHSHPYLRCIFSDQDIRSYESYRDVNPDVLLGLMCDQERFTFYGY